MEKTTQTQGFSRSISLPAILAVVAAMLLASGCVAPIKHATSSGKPEAVVASSDLDQIGASITGEMINRGYNLGQQSKNLLVFTRPDNSFAAGLAYGSSYNRTPAYQVAYTLAPVSAGTRVVADLSVLTNPGSGFQRQTSLNNSESSVSYQNFLNDLANQYQPSSASFNSSSSDAAAYDPYLAPK